MYQIMLLPLPRNRSLASRVRRSTGVPPLSPDIGGFADPSTRLHTQWHNLRPQGMLHNHLDLFSSQDPFSSDRCRAISCTYEASSLTAWKLSLRCYNEADQGVKCLSVSSLARAVLADAARRRESLAVV